VDAGQGHSTLTCQPHPGSSQVVGPVDPRTEALAVDPLHDEAFSQAVLRPEGHVDLRPGHPGPTSQAHEACLDGQAGPAEAPFTC